LLANADLSKFELYNLRSDLAEQTDLHESTVSAPARSSRSGRPSNVRRAQLGEALASTCSDIGAVQGPSEQVDDLVITSEVGEVLERQVDRPRDCTR